jgi:hypothetical protein
MLYISCIIGILMCIVTSALHTMLIFTLFVLELVLISSITVQVYWNMNKLN